MRAVPLAERADGLATLRQIETRGYLAYAYQAKVNEATWLRIAVGAFASRGEAAAFGRVFAAAEGMDFFVTRAPIRVLPGAGELDFVVTPSALWVRGGDGARKVFTFATEAPNDGRLPAAILPELSPDSDAIAFVYDDRLYTATVDGDAALALTEPGAPWVAADTDYEWRPGWSPSGRYVAFLDQAFWEYPIELWVARADGGELRCLACNRDGQSRVRWFVWHPGEDRVLFVEGFAMGTVAVGGGLYSAEMDGTVRTVIAVERGGKREDYEEIAGPLRIEDGFLHFRRVRWLDDNFEQISITDDRLPIGRL
ncbi:MAG: hypothetical protein HKM95_02820 [Inquilinus sp.]|nr:hypothetical protein [Inquilinus sp.]